MGTLSHIQIPQKPAADFNQASCCHVWIAITVKRMAAIYTTSLPDIHALEEHFLYFKSASQALP